jgi:hypothetical protein
LIPGVTEEVLEAEVRGVEVPLKMQVGEIETCPEPPRHRNPRRRNELDITKT